MREIGESRTIPTCWPEEPFTEVQDHKKDQIFGRRGDVRHYDGRHYCRSVV